MDGAWILEHIRSIVSDVRAYRESSYIDWPRHVHLETLAVCNAACNFCPYPTLDRKGIRMSDALIEKIIDDLSAIPQSVPFTLAPYKVNEPFLDKRLVEVLHQVNVRLPNAQLSLFSNGSAFTEPVLRRLATIENVTSLVISLNDHRREPYETLMHMPFDRTVDRLRLLHRLTAEGTFPHQVTINRVMDGSPTDEEFMQWGRNMFPAFTTTLSMRKDWKGQVDERAMLAEAPDLPCRRWFDLSIMATGAVTMCCMDGRGEWPIGNVADENLLDIFNAPTQRAIRADAKTRLCVPACRDCTYL